MHEFLLILKGDGMAALSPEEMQQLFADYKTWVRGLGKKYITGQRLQSTGALVEDKKTIITDGPFLEPKEIIAGYFMIKARDQDEPSPKAHRMQHTIKSK